MICPERVVMWLFLNFQVIDTSQPSPIGSSYSDFQSQCQFNLAYNLSPFDLVRKCMDMFGVRIANVMASCSLDLYVSVSIFCSLDLYVSVSVLLSLDLNLSEVIRSTLQLAGNTTPGPRQHQNERLLTSSPMASYPEILTKYPTTTSKIWPGNSMPV